MKQELLSLLACPGCEGDLACTSDEVRSDGEILTGALTCSACDRSFPIVEGIPRFVPRDNYASSFGLQWNLFCSEQLDSVNGFDLSRQRFVSETGWKEEWLGGRWILDAGCGAGRFLDVASRHDCQVVGVDLSDAVDAAKGSLAGRSNVHLVQASIFELPFRRQAFDGCYCIGVVQHTPDPEQALANLPAMVKAGGQVAVSMYERKRWTLLYSKYLVRPITARMSSRALLRLVKLLMPILFPITEVTFRLPIVGRLFRFIIPISNYVGVNERTNPGLALRQRYRWAVMDTFDMLAPAFDEPQRQGPAMRVLEAAGVRNVRRVPGAAALCLSGEVSRGSREASVAQAPAAS